MAWQAPSAEVAELGSRPGAISMVSSLVAVPISLLSPVALFFCRSQAIHPTARAGAESASTTQAVTGVAPASAVGVQGVGARQIDPHYIDS